MIARTAFAIERLLPPVRRRRAERGDRQMIRSHVSARSWRSHVGGPGLERDAPFPKHLRSKVFALSVHVGTTNADASVDKLPG